MLIKKQLAVALSLVALVTACQAPAAKTKKDAEAHPTAETKTEPADEAETDAEEASDDPTNSHDLKLSDARQAIAKLTQRQTRAEVERALGEPDRTDFINEDGSISESEDARGLRWTYEWKLPNDKQVRFIVGFRSKAAGARITHFYWTPGS